MVAIGTHNQTIYVASCNQADDIVLQAVHPSTWQLFEPIPVVLLASTLHSDDTLAIDNGTLMLIPQHTVSAKEGSGALQTLQVSLPRLGGVAHWNVSHTAGLPLHQKTCERTTAPKNKPARPEDEPSKESVEWAFTDFKGTVSVVVACSLCCAASAIGLINHKCRHNNKRRAGQAPIPLAEAPATNDTVLAVRGGRQAIQELAP